MSLQCGRRTIRFKMRIPIREQLALMVLFCSLMGLMVLALAVWFQNYNFIIGIRSSGLALTASLKAAQLSAILLLYQSQVQAVSTRVLVQSALQRYNSGNNTRENWVRCEADLQAALGNGNLLVQATVYPNFDTGNATANKGLVAVTANYRQNTIDLPFNHTNGSSVVLGDSTMGYPQALYPNLTYGANTSTETASVYYDGSELIPDQMLLLGPLVVNESYALLSATVAVINNTSRAEILGWLTVLIDASMIYTVQESREGLGDSGEVMIAGPARSDNRFAQNITTYTPEEAAAQPIRFIIPPGESFLGKQRHPHRSLMDNAALPFPMGSYTALKSAWTKDNNSPNNAGSYITTKNEEGKTVSVGYATFSMTFVDWALVVEQSHSEVFSPIRHLRDVVLICVFSVTGLLLFIMFPVAHYSVTPIRQLRAATMKTVEPYIPEDGASAYSSSIMPVEGGANDDEPSPMSEEARKEGFFGRWARSKSVATTGQSNGRRRRTFRIPSKVPERKHFVVDELTDLTKTFNEMSDELQMQYERLEERVKERTAELEKAKAAAESANQSKTLFIANISHELKTPLNGILGLATVCMAEEDVGKIRSTLGTIYKSGDLLLHLLTDLLTFSKNEVGQQIAIDESEFRLSDLNAQLSPTFEKQVREAHVDMKVLYLGTNDAFGDLSEFSGDKLYGPSGTGRVRDMNLWGDKNRILQVLMNFVSNSLKFTPPRGTITVRIRCVGQREAMLSRNGSARKSSLTSRRSRNSSSKKVRMSDASLAQAKGPDSDHSESEKPLPNVLSQDEKLSIHVGGSTAHITKVVERRRSMSPPPLNTKDLLFDFEVEDTGPGIPDDQQKKIFEPFVQGDLGLSKKYGGTGLGLSICAQLAALMGGGISLESKVGVGSKFTMRIPLRYISERSPSTASSTYNAHSRASSLGGQAQDALDLATHRRESSSTSVSADPQEAKLSDMPRIVGFSQPYLAKEATKVSSPKTKISEMKKAENEAVKKGKKVRVLVAEDNQVNQEVVLRMLKLEDVYGMYDYKFCGQKLTMADVTIAKDGQEAFDKVRDSMKTGERFDLVFMDVQMPNLDGIQSTKLIREMGFSAPIVALTAFAEKSNEDECMASGMDYFLAKPIRRPALKQVLKKYCATIPEEENEGSTATVPRINDIRKGWKEDFTPRPSTDSIKGASATRVDSTNVSPCS